MSDRPSRARYIVIFVCMLMGVLLYIDRLSFSVAEPYIRQDLGLDKIQTGYCISAFFFFYAFGQMPTGWLSDRFGPRLMLSLYILAWSFFTAAIGLVTGLVMLLVLRGAFGLGQAGAFPTGSNVIGRWIPREGRGGASSLVAAGGRIGGIVYPVLTALLLVNMVPADKEYTLEPDMILDAKKIVAVLYDEEPGKRRHLMYLAASLPSDVKELNQRFEDSSAIVTPAEKQIVSDGFNSVLNNPEFYQSTEFAEIRSLDGYTRDCIARLEDGEVLSSEQSLRFNRFLVEGMFPVAIEGVYVSSWRFVVFVYGGLGIFVAALVWWLLRDHPHLHPWCNEKEQALIHGTKRDTPVHESFPLKEIIASPSMWCSAVSQFFINVAWLFIVTWFVAYLMEEHEVPILQRSWAVTIALAVGAIGMLLGGRVTDYLASGGRSLRKARALPWGGGTMAAAVAFAVCPSLTEPWMITAMMAMVAFSVDFAVPSMWAFTQDVGGKYVGSVLGFGNMIGNFGAAASSPLLAYVAVTYSWNVMFYLCAVVLVISAIAGFAVDASKPLVDDQGSAAAEL